MRNPFKKQSEEQPVVVTPTPVKDEPKVQEGVSNWTRSDVLEARKLDELAKEAATPALIQDIKVVPPTKAKPTRTVKVELTTEDYGLLMIALRYNAAPNDYELVTKFEKAWKHGQPNN